MLQSVDAARTHEIMARYRPIAPKPDLPSLPGQCVDNISAAAAFLRARPCRARKRGRVEPVMPGFRKRPKALLPVPPLGGLGLGLGLSAQGFARGVSLLPPKTPMVPALTEPPPVEQDLLKKLLEPKIITPMPVRPVGSSISVHYCSTFSFDSPASKKKPEEVEEEVEFETEPAVVSDSKNRVRLANSTFKEMVGQPECLWLETMVSTASRRINGKVMLDLPESLEIPSEASGFKCRVKIEWACDGRKSVLDAPCDVSRLHCDSNDYKFTWRIHAAAGFRSNCVA